MRSFVTFTIRVRYILAIISFLIAFKANSQTDTAVQLTDPIIISVTGFEKNLSETSRSTSVVSQEEIRNSVYSNVAELLSQQEGLYIVGTGQNPGNTQSVFMRGANSNHTVIMIDGIRISDPSGINNALDLSELSLANVERIEIVRGSHSTIFGTGAIGGIINIITKKQGQTGFNGFAEAQAGVFGKGTSLFQENLFLNYTNKKGFYADVNGILQNFNGLDATADLPVDPSVFNPQDADDFRNLNVAAKVGFRNYKWDIYAGYKITDQRNDMDDAEFDDDDNAVIDFRRNMVNYGLSYQLAENFRLSVNGGFSKMGRETVDDSSIIDFAGNYDGEYSKATYSGTIWNNEFKAEHLTKSVRTSVGAGRYRETMNNESIYLSPWWTSESSLDTLDLNSTINYAFLYSDINGSLLGEKFSSFSLGLGVRFNHHNLFGNYLTYMVNPSWKVSDNSLLYFSFSTGFNAPSLYQLYNTSIFALGNPKLKPETSKTYEVGVKEFIGKYTTVQLSVFHTEVEQLIEYAQLKNITTQNTYINLSAQTNTGAELSLDHKLSEKISVGGNVSIVNGRNTFSAEDFISNQVGSDTVIIAGTPVTGTEQVTIGLSRRPAYTANVRLGYAPHKRVNIVVSTRMVSSRRDAYFDPNTFSAVNITLENYAVTDFQVNCNITKQLAAHLRVENLFDKRYFEIAGYNTRGRGFFVKLRYTFR